MRGAPLTSLRWRASGDWADGGSGDPRHDVALALDVKPELELSRQALDAFFSGYGSAALDEQTRDWFVRLYDYF